MNEKEKAALWLGSPAVDEVTKETIKTMSDGELIESFYKDLEFGTGGLRGIMGPGTNRMNKYTVGMATQGLANYLKIQFPNESIKVAIAHDSRNNSRHFAETTAAVFSANEIQVYLFEELRPTPELSFAIRELGCKSGVVVTASHNPKEYNGYKAYWEDGGQLISPHDKGVITEVQKIKSIDEVKFDANQGLIKSIGDEIDESYLAALKRLSYGGEINSDLKIVFSSIHGTGITLVPKILEQFGFKNVTIVEEQKTPDGNFPTVVYPNPEETEAMSLALKKAKEIDADLIMATDPDADRVGIGVKNEEGEFQLLNGNQTAAILIYYLLSQEKARGLKGNEFIAKTIVTTDLLTKIADGHGIKTYETLTGFKYIADLILKKEGQERFIGGGEESYGYLIGDAVRDKDAIAACALIAEAIGWAAGLGKSAIDLLLDIYLEFDLFHERLYSLTKKGKSGAEEITAMMKRFRESPPSDLGGVPVIEVFDYQNGTLSSIKDNSQIRLDFPSSNVLQYVLQDGSKVSIRPSGTEPKIKFYFSVHCQLIKPEEYRKTLQSLEKRLDSLQDAVSQ